MSATEEETAIWESIQQDTPLYKDDIVRLHFQVHGFWWLSLYEIDQIDKKLEGNPDFEVLNHSLPDENNIMFWTVRVRHDSPVIAYLIAATILGVCATWLLGPVLHAIGYERRIKAAIAAKKAGVDNEEPTLGEQALQIALAAVAVIVALSWLKGK